MWIEWWSLFVMKYLPLPWDINVKNTTLGLPGSGSEKTALCCEICEPRGSGYPDSWKLQEWDWAPEPPPAVQWPDYQALWLVSVYLYLNIVYRAIYKAKKCEG